MSSPTAAKVVATVPACHGTDAELSNENSCWQNQLLHMAEAHPQREEVEKLLETHAGGVANPDLCDPRFSSRD